LATIDSIVDLAKSMDFKHIALTDHGKMGGIVKFAQRAIEPDENGKTIEAIIGCEMYICDGDMRIKESVDRNINGVVKKRRPKHYHSTMLCMNETGYSNLVNLVNIGANVGYYYEPRVDLNAISENHEGILATSGCMSGMIPQYILREDFKKVDELLDFWRSLFKDNFYLEVQYHGIDFQLTILKNIIELSKRHNIPMIATNDVHYLHPSDKKAHDLLKLMRINNTENTGKGYPTGEFYLKTAKEMYDVWEEMPEVCKNTIEVAEKCLYRFPIKNTWKYPHFDVPIVESFSTWKEKYMPYYNEYQSYLEYLCLKALKNYGLYNNEEYKIRLRYELTKVFEMGVEEYFLILWDVFRFCNENNISTGVARGSAGGSLIVYLLKISGIDPLDPEMNLMFERFLNPGRSSQYNFEIKEYKIKDWKIEYLDNCNTGALREYIYGEIKDTKDKEKMKESFPNMIRELLPLENQKLDEYYYWIYKTGKKFNKNDANSWILYYIGAAPKPDGELKVEKMGSLPDIDSDFDPNYRDKVINYIKVKYGEDKVINIGTYGQYRARAALRETLKASGYSHDDATEISKTIPFTFLLKDAVELSIVQKTLSAYKVTNQIINNALKIEGSAFSHVSEHAAGIVISPTTLNDKIPMHRAQDSVVSQFDMNDMERVGYIKFDFLGLSNVGKIAKCNEYIEKRHGKKVDFRKIPRNNKDVLNLFKSGRTETVFQFSSDGIKETLKEVGVDSFNDLIAVNALYRPGPMKYISKRMYERFKTKDDPEWQFGMTYAENKKFPDKITYLHDDLKSILSPTYSILCYQEQVMEISQKFAKFTAQEADVLRKAIGKKNGDLFETCKNKFYKGAIENGYSEKLVKLIWKKAEDFANYSFNKAHAAAYALIGYWNAYLAVTFPYEWYAASINEDIDKEDRYSKYIIEAKNLGICIEKPNVMQSTLECYVEYGADDDNPVIILPLNIIKGIGKNAKDVVNNRPYVDFKDFCYKSRPDKRLFEKMLQAGTLKCFGTPLELVRKYSDIRNNWKEDSKNYIEEAQSQDILQLFGSSWGQSIDMKMSE
jgi:DNA polymerase-3 subunit alpha